MTRLGRGGPGDQAETDDQHRDDVGGVARDQPQRLTEVRTGATAEEQHGVRHGVGQEQQPAPHGGTGSKQGQDDRHHHDGPAQGYRPTRRDNDGERSRVGPRSSREPWHGVASDEVAHELGRGGQRPRGRPSDRRQLSVQPHVTQQEHGEGHPDHQVAAEGDADAAQSPGLGERDRHEAQHDRVEDGPLLEQQASSRGQHHERPRPAAAILQPVQQGPGREEQEDGDREVLDGHRPPLGGPE